MGESQGWPAKGWAQGVFDIALEPKPKAFLMKSLFTEEPLVILRAGNSASQVTLTMRCKGLDTVTTVLETK